MKVLGRTKTHIYFGRQPGIGKPVNIAVYERTKKGPGEFMGQPRWLGTQVDWEDAWQSILDVPGIKIDDRWRSART